MLDLGTSWTRRCRSGTSLGSVYPLDFRLIIFRTKKLRKTAEVLTLGGSGVASLSGKRETWWKLRVKKDIDLWKNIKLFQALQRMNKTKQHSRFGTFGLLLLPELHVLGYLPIETAIAGWALLHRPNYVPKLLSWLQGSCIPCDHEKTLISWVTGFISFRCCISRTFPLPHHTLCFLQWRVVARVSKLWRSVRWMLGP